MTRDATSATDDPLAPCRDASGHATGADVSEAWDCLEAGLAQLEALPLDDPRLTDRVAELQWLVEHRLIAAAADDPRDARQRLEPRIAALERRFAPGRQGPVREPQGALDELIRQQISVDLLWPLVSRLAGAGWHPFRELHAHLDHFQGELQRRGGDGEAARDLRAEVATIRLELFEVQVRSFLEAVDASEGEPPASGDAEAQAVWATRQWRASRYGEHLLRTLHRHLVEQGRLAEDASLLASLESAVDRLGHQALETVRPLPDSDAVPWLDTQAHALNDFATETLAEAELWPRRTALFAYTRVRHRLEAFAEDSAGRHPEAERRIRRLNAQATNEWVEKSVLAGLEERFGRRFVGWLDNAVLILILAAVGLLMMEWQFHPTGDARLALALADTAICGGLLFDFLIRLYHAPARGNFFRRHWLTDLIPSIPFGLIALGLDHLASAQHTTLARLLRIPALIARKARPLVRVLRIFLFMVRGLDRLARRYSWLLNRDVVFFEPAPRQDPESVFKERTEVLRRRLRAQRRRLEEALPTEAWAAPQHQDLALYRARARPLAAAEAGAAEASDEASASESAVAGRMATGREIRIETVIETLVNVDVQDLEERLDRDFPDQVARLARMAHVPPLRWMPVFRDIHLAAKTSAERGSLAADVARRLGRRLQDLNDRLLFFADLHGVITAPQLVDRIGNLMVQSMRRHAKRLLIIGVGFVVLTLLIEVLGVAWLGTVLAWLRANLGLPILILGIVAWGIVLLGSWLQRIAATTTDHYVRAAEAQFLSLLKDTKRLRRAGDQHLLKRRVLDPEGRVRGQHPTDSADSVIEHHGAEQAFRSTVANSLGDTDPGPGSLAERVYLLYRDYLSGTPLHRSDVKTTNQLLGNLYLQDLIHNLLQLDKRGVKDLKSLDLENGGGRMFGPALWFNFITLALAHRTGMLIEDYNRHVLPLADRQASDTDDPAMQRWQWWLRRKGHEADEEPPEAARRAHVYATTTFTALDFLTWDPERSATIERRFGADVRQLLEGDRKRLIREIFGTLPYYAKPVTERSINPYTLYWRYLGSGRVFLLPLTLLLFLGAWIGRGLRWFWRTLRELLDPQRRQTVDPDLPFAGYEVAVRKIHRMRRPVFLAACRLRALADVEYLGLALPGASEETLTETVRDDLDFIRASLVERDPFTAIEARQRERLAEFSADLEGPLLSARLTEWMQHSSHPRREVLRALTMAYVANFRGVRDRLRVAETLRTGLEQAIASRGWGGNGTVGLRWFGQWPRAAMRRLRRRGQRGERAATFDAWWRDRGRHQVSVDWAETLAYRWVKRYWRVNRGGLRDAIAWEAECPAWDCQEAGLALLEEVARNPTPWSEQLVTLRAVQSLTILDLDSDLDLVRNLGEYEDADEPPQPVRVPTL